MNDCGLIELLRFKLIVVEVYKEVYRPEIFLLLLQICYTLLSDLILGVAQMLMNIVARNEDKLEALVLLRSRFLAINCQLVRPIDAEKASFFSIPNFLESKLRL